MGTLPVEISSDLVFADESLEAAYREHHTEAQRRLDVQFHYARSAAWAAVGLRMLKDSAAREDYLGSAIVLLGALTTLVPAAAHGHFKRRGKYAAYVRLRPAVVLADNVLQVALGCFTHGHIYPEAAASWRGAAAWRALGATATGSGVAWLCMSSLLGSLIFRFAMVQQATLAIIMMLASRAMCGRSFALQKGHMAARAALAPLARAALGPPARALGLAAALSPLLDATSPPPGSPADAALALDVCLALQPLALLALGLVAPTLYLFAREAASRVAFVEALARRRGLRAAVSPPPSLLGYWAFAAPAVVMLYAYVRV